QSGVGSRRRDLREGRTVGTCERRITDNQNRRNYRRRDREIMDALKETAQKVVARAVQKGATSADVLIREEDTFSVSVRMGEVETLKQAISRNMLLRVYNGKRMATCTTSELSDGVVLHLVDEAVEMATLTSEDESGGLPDHAFFAKSFPDLNLVDSSWDK